MNTNEPTISPDAAAIGEPQHHPRDLHMDAAGTELWNLIQQWRARWQPMRAEYLWAFSQIFAMELRAFGREERDKLDGK